MTPRAMSWVLALGLCACQLPGSDGPPPVGAAIGPTSPTTQRTAQPARKTPTRPTTEPGPRESSQPSDPPPNQSAPGTETGALVGVRAAHDQARAAVGVASLTWSDELGRVAQDWANHLAANSCQLAHRQSSGYGENLFWSSNAVTATEVVAAWVAESSSFDASTKTCAQGSICGHYTQVVWAGSKKLGCGMASCGSAQVWVCNYDPPGNMMGQQPY